MFNSKIALAVLLVVISIDSKSFDDYQQFLFRLGENIEVQHTDMPNTLDVNINGHEEISENSARVYGITNTQALKMDGVSADELPYDYVCSKPHRDNDESNRWCHAAVVEVVNQTLQDLNVNKTLAYALASSVFVIKEHAYDLNPSKEDIVSPQIVFFNRKEKTKSYPGGPRHIQKVSATFFLDGRFHLTFEW